MVKMTEELSFYQINLNKCEAAQANLMVELNDFKDKQYVCLIQEPHFKGLKPSSIDRRYMQVLHGAGTKKDWPRAMIVASKSLKISQIEALTSRDTTCVNLHNSKEELVVCSSYQDITFPEVTNNIDKCVEYSKTIDKSIIIGADSNAHSELWMSESANQRGEIFEDFITLNNLFVCNIGNKYTYDCATGQSIIDITLVSNYLVDRVNNWKVHDEHYFTDHKLISFNINFKKQPPGVFRNFKKANWSYFKNLLAKQSWENPPKFWSKQTLELEAEKLTKDITQALDKVCPQKVQTTKSKPPSWWTPELSNLRGQVRAAKTEFKKLSSDPNTNQDKILKKHNAFKSINKEFSKSIKYSKRNSWRALTSNCEDIYMLNKIIYKKQQNSISMMEGCNTGLQTNNTLMDSHFPGSTPRGLNPQSDCKEQPEASSEPTDKIVNDKDLNDLNFLDPIRVKEAFNDMKAHNAGGPDTMKSVVFQNLPDNILARISKIYKVCIKLSHTPQSWCEADVIFLAKPDKASYDVPNSFRPISKFNVILKELEKLVKWELERTSLSFNPLHKTQHAYSFSLYCTKVGRCV